MLEMKELGQGCSGGPGSTASSLLRGEFWLEDVPAARVLLRFWQIWLDFEKSSLGICGVLLSPGSGVSPQCHLAAESTVRCPRGKLMQNPSNEL